MSQREIFNRIEIIEAQIRSLQYELRNLKMEFQKYNIPNMFTEEKVLERMDTQETITLRIKYLHDIIRTVQFRLAEKKHPLQQTKSFI